MAKTKRRSSRARSRARADKQKVIDPPFSSRLHKGTKASSECALCKNKYHYQDYMIFSQYLEHLLHTEKISTEVRVPKDFSDMTLGLELSSGDIKPYYVSEKDFMSNIRSGMKDKKTKFIPVILNLEITSDDNHANVLVINKNTNEIELFEPHGYRTSASTLGGIASAYQKKMRYLKRYWKARLSTYKVVNVVDSVKRTAFQTEKDPDDHSGYCITWSLLYTHYRILNPDISTTTLLSHIDHKITTRLLMRYAKHVEETLKSL